MSHALYGCVVVFVPLGYEVLREDYDGAPSGVLFPWPMVTMGYPPVVLFSAARLTAGKGGATKSWKHVMICGSVKSRGMYHMGTYSGVHSYGKKPALGLQSIREGVPECMRGVET